MMYLGKDPVGLVTNTKMSTGSITPTEELSSITIDTGFLCNSITIVVEEKTLISNKRQFIGFTYTKYNNFIYEVIVTSNATGSSIANCGIVTEDNQQDSHVTVNGNFITINIGRLASNCRMLVGKNYKWFAYG